MYLNQLILSFIVFGALLFLMNDQTNNHKNNEHFYALNQRSIVPYHSNYMHGQQPNKALYYWPSHPYLTYPPLNPQKINMTDLNKRYNQFNKYNYTNNNNNINNITEGFTHTEMINPKINNMNKNNKYAVKITFILMTLGLAYYLYQNRE
jgi:hypothetical protein